jgi:hypothetical protein
MYSAKLDLSELPQSPGTAGSEARGTLVASQQPWSGPRTGFSKRMTDSNEEGELRGTAKCLLPGKERSTVTNRATKNAKREENVRT